MAKRMKPKLIIMGLTMLFLVAMCGVIFLTGVTGWLLILNPNEQLHFVKVTPWARVMLPPLATPSATSFPTKVVDKQEATSSPTSLREDKKEPITTAPSPMVATPTNTPDKVAETLGFSLPVGSVNSVTHQGVATKLVIPKLKLESPIVLAPIKNQTWQIDDLGQTVAHLEGTAPPGSNSNMVLAGHVTIAKGIYGPFAGLSLLTPGDLVIVYEKEQAFRYEIDSSQTVDRTAVEVTYPSTSGQITLITCSQWNKQEGRYLNRLVVKGHLLEN